MNLEVTLILEQFALRRTHMLENIALDQMMRRDILIPVNDVARIKQDNFMTETEMTRHFSDRAVTSSDVEEAHFERCLASGVEYCICMPDKVMQGVDLL